MPLPRITRLSNPPSQPQQQKERDLGDHFDLGELLSMIKVKGVKGDKPTKGVDYFTKKDIAEFLDAATPIKGKHYFDGQKGRDGKDGKDGRDGKDGIDGIPGKDGRHGKDGKDGRAEDLEEFREEIMQEVKKILGKKIKLGDIDELENRLNLLSQKVEKNYGGHGGTTHVVAATLVSGGTYNLASPYPILGELQVYVGGGRVFSQNGDFTYVVTGGNRVTQISLNGIQQANIAQGAILNILGK